MRIVTYNMRGGGSRARWSAMLDAFDPDIAFVQETRRPAEFAADLLDARDLGRAHWTAAAHGKWGSSLWVREGEIEPVTTVSGESWWAAGGIVHARGQRLFACSVHTAPIKGSYVRSTNAFLDALSALLAGIDPATLVVLGGDWNHCVSERCAGDPRTNTPAETKVLTRLRDEFGLRSAWSVANPDAVLPQTLRFAQAPKIPFHIDGVFLPGAWADRVTSVRVVASKEWATRSDHNPVVVELSARLGEDVTPSASDAPPLPVPRGRRP